MTLESSGYIVHGMVITSTGPVHQTGRTFHTSSTFSSSFRKRPLQMSRWPTGFGDPGQTFAISCLTSRMVDEGSTWTSKEWEYAGSSTRTGEDMKPSQIRDRALKLAWAQWEEEETDILWRTSVSGAVHSTCGGDTTAEPRPATRNVASSGPWASCDHITCHNIWRPEPGAESGRKVTKTRFRLQIYAILFPTDTAMAYARRLNDRSDSTTTFDRTLATYEIEYCRGHPGMLASLLST